MIALLRCVSPVSVHFLFVLLYDARDWGSLNAPITPHFGLPGVSTRQYTGYKLSVNSKAGHRTPFSPTPHLGKQVPRRLMAIAE